MFPLKVLIEERLLKKKNKAEDAYIRAGTSKETRNCRYHGTSLADRISVCTIKCQGMNESEAGICHNQKAQGCSQFKLIKSEEALRVEFRKLSDSEIALRWPSIGELLWILRNIDNLKDSSIKEES